MKQALAEAVQFRAPEGFHAAVRAAAEQKAMKPAEFIRRAVIEAAKRVTQSERTPLVQHEGPQGLIAA